MRIRGLSGGVGRNIAEALGKLGHPPLLISRLGNDLFGSQIRADLLKGGMDLSGISTSPGKPTAIYTGLLTQKAECLFGLGDMGIHEEIQPDNIRTQIPAIEGAPLLLLDANINVETMQTTLRLCFERQIPVWFEPTEIRKARKIAVMERETLSTISYLSPNILELFSLTSTPFQADSPQINSIIQDLSWKCFEMFPNLRILLLTRGSKGLTVVTREGFKDYPPPTLDPGGIVSVSGAGDCLNAGFISGILNNLSIEECVQRGIGCARDSLHSSFNVPESFVSIFPKKY